MSTLTHWFLLWPFNHTYTSIVKNQRQKHRKLHKNSLITCHVNFMWSQVSTMLFRILFSSFPSSFVISPLTHSFSHYFRMSSVPSFIWFYTIRPPTHLLYVLPVFLLLPIHHSCSPLCWLLPPVSVFAYWPYGRQCSRWPCAVECFALVMHTWLSDIVAPCLPHLLPFYFFHRCRFCVSLCTIY